MLAYALSYYSGNIPDECYESYLRTLYGNETISTWNEFKKLFNKVHTGFFLKLRRNFPHLTDTDMRLLSLIKLNLNNKEMANMLGITVEGIKKAKQRLRKKMQLPADTSFEEMLAKI